MPYTTEEEASGKNTITAGGYPLNFDHSQIFERFERDLREADAARRAGAIDFIIVYGHAPLATAPHCEHLHQGLFNSLAAHAKVPMGDHKHEFARRLLTLLKEIHVDLYLSGHNHQYERLTIAHGNNEPILTTLTVGLGTQLRHAKLKPK